MTEVGRVASMATKVTVSVTIKKPELGVIASK